MLFQLLSDTECYYRETWVTLSFSFVHRVILWCIFKNKSLFLGNSTSLHRHGVNRCKPELPSASWDAGTPDLLKRFQSWTADSAFLREPKLCESWFSFDCTCFNYFICSTLTLKFFILFLSQYPLFCFSVFNLFYIFQLYLYCVCVLILFLCMSEFCQHILIHFLFCHFFAKFLLRNK